MLLWIHDTRAHGKNNAILSNLPPQNPHERTIDFCWAELRPALFYLWSTQNLLNLHSSQMSLTVNIYLISISGADSSQSRVRAIND